MSEDERTRLALAASLNPPQWSFVLVRELIAQASVSQLSFISSVATTVNLPSHQQHLGTRDREAGVLPQGRERKKRRGTEPLRTRLIDLSTQCNAVVTNVLFPLLGLPEHFRLARCCKRFLTAAGVPPPHVRSSPPWNKHVTLNDGTDWNVQRLASFAPMTSMTLGGGGCFTDSGMGYLRHLPLRLLDLSNCHIIKQDKFTVVEWTYCSNITDGGLVHLQHLVNLQHLNLSRCRLITDGGLVHLQHLPVEHLDLRGCENITDGGLVHLQQLPLRHLGLKECWNITDGGLVHLRVLPLQYLGLSNCTNITDGGLIHLQYLPLQRLDLTGCHHITDRGLVHLRQLHLQHLNLSSCTSIEDGGLVYLQHFPLQHLDLSGCDISDTGLAHLRQLPLRHLNLQGTLVQDFGMVQLQHLPLQYIILDFCSDVFEVDNIANGCIILRDVDGCIISRMRDDDNNDDSN